MCLGLNALKVSMPVYQNSDWKQCAGIIIRVAKAEISNRMFIRSNPK
jgi:hypothetical protein